MALYTPDDLETLQGMLVAWQRDLDTLLAQSGPVADAGTGTALAVSCRVLVVCKFLLGTIATAEEELTMAALHYRD